MVAPPTPEWVVKQLVSQTLGYTARNPAEALFFGMAIANPTTRKLAIKVGLHVGKQMVVDIGFYSRLVGSDLLAPAARKIGWAPAALAAIHLVPTGSAQKEMGLGSNLAEYHLTRPTLFDAIYKFLGGDPNPRPYGEIYSP